jgi:carboxyl-terminal processing protease
MRRYPVLSAAIFAVMLSALAGGLFGRGALAVQDGVPEHHKTFAAAVSAIEARYGGKAEADRLVYSAITGMLQTLDPHSSFMDPRTYEQLRERQEGRYYGLGITITVVDGDITVVALFEGSPAYKKGIRRGDIIASIEGESAKGWTSEQAVRKLRGPKGTTVSISLRRPGYSDLIHLEVLRDEINIPTIPAKFMVDSTTGYVRLQDFAENTDRDLANALRELSGQGMRRLVLDLRSNPGGPLDQAIKVSNRFLPRGELIVSTRGRIPNADIDYVAKEEGEFTGLPLVVLVNRSSASASEIVAGAIQDHDRGLIVGETTFGKALVQSVYRVQGAGLALTTARYYTPSGRLIQRPWDGTDFLTYTMGEQSPQERTAEEYETDGGRKVFAGGGIEPDHRMDGPIEGFNPSRLGRTLYSRQLFASFAQKFYAEGDDRIGLEGAARKVVPSDFVVDDRMLKDFRQHLLAENMSIDEEAFERDKDFVRAMIRYDIDLALFGVAHARRNLAKLDPQMRFALGLLDEAEQLAARAQPRQKRGR